MGLKLSLSDRPLKATKRQTEGANVAATHDSQNSPRPRALRTPSIREKSYASVSEGDFDVFHQFEKRKGRYDLDVFIAVTFVRVIGQRPDVFRKVRVLILRNEIGETRCEVDGRGCDCWAKNDLSEDLLLTWYSKRPAGE